MMNAKDIIEAIKSLDDLSADEYWDILEALEDLAEEIGLDTDGDEAASPVDDYLDDDGDDEDEEEEDDEDDGSF